VSSIHGILTNVDFVSKNSKKDTTISVARLFLLTTSTNTPAELDLSLYNFPLFHNAMNQT
jgi:hypothetical protein